MVYRTISSQMKQHALELLDQGWEVSDIVDALGMSSKSITRWEDNYETFGDVAPPSGLRGHPHILTMLMTGDLCQMISESPSLYLDEIGEWLAIYHNQPISRSALHRNLQDLALTCKKLCRVAAECNEEFRSEWLDNILTNYSTDQLVFLDESSKDNHVLLRQYGRSTTGEDAVDSMPLDQGFQYSVLPALTIDGYMAVHVVEGSIDGSEFFDFVVQEVVSQSFCSKARCAADVCPTSAHEWISR